MTVSASLDRLYFENYDAFQRLETNQFYWKNQSFFLLLPVLKKGW
jgi:hypothetical protein